MLDNFKAQLSDLIKDNPLTKQVKENTTYLTEQTKQKKEDTKNLLNKKKEQIVDAATETVNDMKEGAVEIKKNGAKKSVSAIADFFLDSFRDRPDEWGN